MGLFTGETFNNLDELLVHQLKDLYDAEQRFKKALPKMAEAATNPQLKTAFQDHERETEQQIDRLKQCFEKLGKTAEAVTCEAAKGLVSEGSDYISAKGDDNVRDAALIAAGQRVEHYEIAGYGTARNLAQQCGHPAVADLLQKTLDEEGAADKKLTQLAESGINATAA